MRYLIIFLVSILSLTTITTGCLKDRSTDDATEEDKSAEETSFTKDLEEKEVEETPTETSTVASDGTSQDLAGIIEQIPPPVEGSNEIPIDFPSAFLYSGDYQLINTDVDQGETAAPNTVHFASSDAPDVVIQHYNNLEEYEITPHESNTSEEHFLQLKKGDRLHNILIVKTDYGSQITVQYNLM